MFYMVFTGGLFLLAQNVVNSNTKIVGIYVRGDNFTDAIFDKVFWLFTVWWAKFSCTVFGKLMSLEPSNGIYEYSLLY